MGVVERQKTLNQISDTLESVKQEMEERGATMSDGCQYYLKPFILLPFISEIITASYSTGVTLAYFFFNEGIN